MSQISDQIKHDKWVRSIKDNKVKNAAIEAYIGWHAPGIFNLRCGVRRKQII